MLEDQTTWKCQSARSGCMRECISVEQDLENGELSVPLWAAATVLIKTKHKSVGFYRLRGIISHQDE